MVDKIVICGSRPDPKIIKADFFYYVNGAISIADHNGHGIVSQVIAKNAFLKASAGNNPIDRAWIESVISNKAETIFFVGMNEVDLVLSLYKSLGGNIDRSKIVDILPEERNHIIKSVCGIVIPVGYRVAMELAMKFHFKPLVKSLKYIFKGRTRHINWESGDCPGILRPSNGVFALVNAVYKHGESCEYYLSGVGMDFYDYSYSFSGSVVRKNKNIRPHLLADISVLRGMRKYNIFVDDPFVADICGLKFIK